MPARVLDTAILSVRPSDLVVQVLERYGAPGHASPRVRLGAYLPERTASSAFGGTLRRLPGFGAEAVPDGPVRD